MDEVRIALFGCGRQGQRHSRNVLKMNDSGVRVVAAVDSDPDRARQLAADHGCWWGTDYREALARDDVNTVYVVLPHMLLAQAVIDAARAGKHILCQKPIDVRACQAEAAVKACEEAGVKLMIGGQHRYRSVVRGMREIIASGEVGQVFLVEDSRKTHGFGPDYPSWYRSGALTGGGVVPNSTSHSLDLLRFVLGSEISSVYAMMGRFVHDIDGEDNSVMAIRFDNGALGTSATSWWGDGSWTEVTGTKGQIRLDVDDALYVDTGGGRKRVAETPDGEDERFTLDQYFIRCLREDLPPSPSGGEYLGVVRAIEAAYRSTELKREMGTAKVG